MNVQGNEQYGVSVEALKVRMCVSIYIWICMCRFYTDILKQSVCKEKSLPWSFFMKTFNWIGSRRKSLKIKVDKLYRACQNTYTYVNLYVSVCVEGCLPEDKAREFNDSWVWFLFSLCNWWWIIIGPNCYSVDYLSFKIFTYYSLGICTTDSN